MPSNVARTQVLSRPHLLIVDDDELVARMLTRVLRRRYEVMSCSSARDALALLAAGPPFDLVLCDVQMQEMDGEEFFRQLRQINPAQAERFATMSGAPSPTNSVPHLMKPFTPEDVGAVLAQLTLAQAA